MGAEREEDGMDLHETKFNSHAWFDKRSKQRELVEDSHNFSRNGLMTEYDLNMRFIHVFLTAALLLLNSTANGQQQSFQNLTVDGDARRYLLYLPTNFDPAENLPVMMWFHGGGGNANGGTVRSGFPIVGQHRTVHRGVCRSIPDVLEGCTCWGYDLGGETNGNYEKDLAYASAVVDDLVASYNADARRIYAGGYSMGGSLCGIWRVPRATNLPRWPQWPPACTATPLTTCSTGSPTVICHILGTADFYAPYDGASWVASVNEQNDFWVNKNQSETTPEVVNLGGGVTRYTWGPEWVVTASNISAGKVADMMSLALHLRQSGILFPPTTLTGKLGAAVLDHVVSSMAVARWNCPRIAPPVVAPATPVILAIRSRVLNQPPPRAALVQVVPLLSPESCASSGGSFTGLGSVCETGCEPGACCLGDYLCDSGPRGLHFGWWHLWWWCMYEEFVLRLDPRRCGWRRRCRLQRLGAGPWRLGHLLWLPRRLGRRWCGGAQRPPGRPLQLVVTDAFPIFSSHPIAF